MSKQTLRQYFDTNIANENIEDSYYRLIKHKMKAGKKEWKIEIDDYCHYPAHNYSHVCRNIYVNTDKLICLVDFAHEQKLTTDFVEEEGKCFIVIKW